MSDSEGDKLTEVTFRDFTPENEAELRLLNSAIFPIRYSDKFYVECAAAGRVTQLAYVGTELVGGIACRLELTADKSGARMYIMTVGVLAPYRNGAIGTRLLQHALNEGRADTFLQDAYLHVQSNNDDAIAFYTRFGFKRDQLVLNYYKRLDPPDAVVLKLDLKEWKVNTIEGVEYGGEDKGPQHAHRQPQQMPPPTEEILSTTCS
mmetsp:Transcript_9272/g.14768  ORF Transcript_9272/g.14768 Transcript_9272/m.14768 type:complete len:206 (-) Transcript_9272:600-1217(-)